MDTLFYLGIIFIFGALTEWLSPKLKIPRVVGFILLGLLIGPEVLSIIPASFVENSSLIINVSLSIIALLIGATIKVKYLKAHGKEVAYITLWQSLFTFFVVAGGFILLSGYLPFNTIDAFVFSLIIASIATATAPAAPMAIVHELKAKGKFTSTFLAVVALDDAVALIIFILTITLASTAMDGILSIEDLMNAFFVLFLSIVIGYIPARINALLEKLFAHNKGMETISTIGLLFVVYSVSEHFNLEPILSAMVMGFFMSNTSDDFDFVEEEIDSHLMDIIFMLFFVVSAMHLKIDSIGSILWIISAYIVLRAIGKISGAYIGSSISHSDEFTKKHIGFALLPQAGVAIGLALSVQHDVRFEHISYLVLNVVIATTFVHELFGPMITEYIIKKSGDVKEENLDNS